MFCEQGRATFKQRFVSLLTLSRPQAEVFAFRLYVEVDASSSVLACRVGPQGHEELERLAIALSVILACF